MKVQRCPSCGARYNVGRVEPGATFACRRCQTRITVASPSPSGYVSWGLFTAGLLMIAAMFLVANPHYGTGAPRWPWEEFRRSPSYAVKATFLLWVFTALWAWLTALVPAARGRSLLTLPLGLLLLVVGCSGGAIGLPITDLQPLDFMLGVVALGAGLEVVRRGGRRGPASLLLLSAVAVIGWQHAKGFPPDEWGSHLQILVRDLGDWLKGDLAARQTYVYELLFARWVLFLACGAGLLAVVWKRRGVGLVGLLLLVIALLTPSAARFGDDIGYAGLNWSSLARNLTKHGAAALVTEGLALFTLCVWAAADLVRRGGSPR